MPASTRSRWEPTEDLWPSLPTQEFSRALAELERAFRDLSEILLFKQQNLPLPVLTIQTRGRRRRVLGWFVNRAWTDGTAHLPEINIAAESLS